MATNRSRPNRNRSQPERQVPRETAPRTFREVDSRRPARPTDIEPPDVYDRYDEPEADPAVAQELEAGGHYVTADLCGEPVRIIPPGAWRQSWMRHLNEGRIDDFAGSVIHPDDMDLYDELDPTNDEFGEFVGEAATRSGESLGKSRGPAQSSRRTRRR